MATEHDDKLNQLREVRDEALLHYRRAQELARKRREIIRELMEDGLSQSDIARELGVTRQAIQKMMAV